MPIHIQVNIKQPQGYCDLARRLSPGLDTNECVERSYVNGKEPPLGERAVRALCGEPSIELAAKTASFGAARLYPALGPVSELAIKFGLREFCNYTLRYARTNAVNP